MNATFFEIEPNVFINLALVIRVTVDAKGAMVVFAAPGRQGGAYNINYKPGPGVDLFLKRLKAESSR
jgi:hypothetical protein